MGYDIFEEVDKLLEVVDNAVMTGDYSNLKNHVGEIVEPMKKRGYDDRFFDGQNRSRSNNAYHNGNPGGQYRTGGQGGNSNRTGGQGGNAYRYGGQGGGQYGRGMNGYSRNQGGGYNAGHMENRGNAFYGSYSSGRAGQRYGASAPGRGGQPHGATGYAPRQEDPLTGETDLFKKVENPLLNQVKQVIGFMGTIASGLVALIIVAATIGLILEGVTAGVAAVGIVFSLFSVGVTAAFVKLAMDGRKGIARMQRYVQYRTVLMKKSFASVKELAEKTNVPEDQVVKELKELTAMGFFKQGRFDKKETTFICADEVYRLYQQAEESERIRQEEEAERRKQAGYIPEDVMQLLNQGNEYVKKIQEANAKIPSKEVSEKLDRMENIVARIFVEVQKNPSLAGNLSMFMDYYLPTTTKLMDAYIEMDSNPVQGENIINSKREIEETLDTVNDAFENLLNSFFKEKALDVSTDISVMKNMMRQQGLTPDDLELIRRQQEAELAGSATIPEMQEYIRQQEEAAAAPTLENIRKQLAEEDARAAREAGKKTKEDAQRAANAAAGAQPTPEYYSPTLEDIRRQLAEEDARAARGEQRGEGGAANATQKPLSFDEQLELEAQQGLLMTGNGGDDDIF
ncbi:MAG: 5-bromo-4-chloroindolyl phosphate hydrolysis family protein [Lachnospiraceae bacterium]|nr:5-bromo-4-chloroindolyl phosphate hydrolysis family protein [Lachnospiraceae bacterium]